MKPIISGELKNGNNSMQAACRAAITEPRAKGDPPSGSPAALGWHSNARRPVWAQYICLPSRILLFAIPYFMDYCALTGRDLLLLSYPGPWAIGSPAALGWHSNAKRPVWAQYICLLSRISLFAIPHLLNYCALTGRDLLLLSYPGP